MAHFAEIDQSNNKVIRVVKINDADCIANGGEDSTEMETWMKNNTGVDDYLLDTEYGGGPYPTVYWKRCSYNTREGKYYTPADDQSFDTEDSDQSKALRANYPSPGWFYDSTNNIFHEPQPITSWTLNTTTGLYDPPVAYPPMDATTAGSESISMREWDEDNSRWIGIDGNDARYAWNPSTSAWEAL